MRDRWLRVLLVVQAVGSGVPGAFALLWPLTFYKSFPGGGRAWVAADGPYNEHLVRDFGSLNLALTVVAIAAAWRLTPTVVRAAALASLTFGVPHLIYHVAHIDKLDGSDQVAEIGALAFSLAVSLLILLMARTRTAPDRLP
jgi:hypothetical protein